MTDDPMLYGITAILVNEGADTEGGWHSWRCFDKDRYPDPCTCTRDVAAEIVALVTAEITKVREDERGKVLEGVPTAEWDELSYEQGQRDERERIRTGVTRLAFGRGVYVLQEEVLAVMDGGES